ncbi:MAG: hypothetical protein KC420_02055 [Myxococcales bacterium]|nr:hypothetical protein [Myxococcales bacterium]
MKIKSPSELRSKQPIESKVAKKMSMQPQALEHVVDLADPDPGELAAVKSKLEVREWAVAVEDIEGGKRLKITSAAPLPPGAEHHVIAVARKSATLVEAAHRLMVKPAKVAAFIESKGLVVADVIGSQL